MFEDMTSSRKGFTVLEGCLLGAVVLICAAVLLPLLARPTNCGGNSAALTACEDIALSLQIISSDHGDKSFSVSDLGPAEREYFRRVAGLSWLPDSKILVAPGPIVLRAQQPKMIIAVCDRPFDNVPRRLFGKAPATHAVAYSDGSTGLITVGEFRRSDFSRFVDVRTIPEKRLPAGAANRSQPTGPETNRTSAAAGSGR